MNQWLADLRWWGPLSRLGATVALATFVLDQTNKWWTIHIFDLPTRGRVAVLPFLDLVYLINSGVSYSLIEMKSPAGQAALSLFAVAVSVGILAWLAQTTSRLGAISLGLIMGGALANALDRPFLGGVADFFQLHAFGYSWYVFNIADVAIVAGVIGLLYDSLLGESRTSR
jgi:signal peptidase II